MADRPDSDPVGAGAGRGDPESPDEATIRLEPRPARESHSFGDTAPGALAGQPSVQQDANIQGGSASTLRGPDPLTEVTYLQEEEEHLLHQLVGQSVHRPSFSELAPGQVAMPLADWICGICEQGWGQNGVEELR